MLIFLLFSFFGLVSILVPSFCFTIDFCLSLLSCASLSSSSLFRGGPPPPPLYLSKNYSLGQTIDFLHSTSYLKGMREKKMQKVKWERGSHIYIRWTNWVIFENNRVVCEMWYRSLDTNLGDALYFFVGFQKRIIVETWHWFNDAFFVFFFLWFWKCVVVETWHQLTNPFSHSFSLDIVSTKIQKVPMDVRRWILFYFHPMISHP